MSVFDDCLKFELHWEGGNSNDPLDPGGRTRKGITQRTYDLWRDNHGLPRQDVWAMTDSECHDIYEEEYWTRAYCTVLEPSLALMLFDSSVNMGIHEATVLLQIASGAHPDGVFGPETLEKATAPPFEGILRKFHDERRAKYRSLSGWDRYGKGWEQRNDACLELALSWLSPKEAGA